MNPEKAESGSPAPRTQVALHRRPANGIGTIEDDDPFAGARCIAHLLIDLQESAPATTPMIGTTCS